MSPVKLIDEDEDRIAALFHGRIIFITGATGFIGQVLVEKLLRSCSGLKCIYLLIRCKKGNTPQQRHKAIFDNALFSLLKKEQPDALKKCKLIVGDITKIDLGISPADRKLLQDEVEFIYHSAASVRFDESIEDAVKLNTRSTKYLLDLAKQCDNLKLFVHISTAFAFPKEKIVYDKVYQPPADPHHILKLLEEGNLESHNILGDYPNTYTFTKALAEGLVAECMEEIPAVIVRPSYVIAAAHEPIPGWVSSLQGPSGLVVAACKGLIHTMFIKDMEDMANVIPVDILANMIFLFTWSHLTINTAAKVANLTSSEYTVSYQKVVDLGKPVALDEVPLNNVMWYPTGVVTNSKWKYHIYNYLFHIIPTVIYDVILALLGQKPFALQTQQRIFKSINHLNYFLERSWNFSTFQIDQLQSHMNAKERSIYGIGDVDLTSYVKNCAFSVRRYILNESDDTIPAARKHLKLMWLLHLVCKWIIIIVFLYIIYKLLLLLGF